MSKRKHVPQRTCICCGLKMAKRDLLRVVSAPDGKIVVDVTGRQNGRGAYICASCCRSAENIRRGRLEYSLKTKIDEDEWKVLTETLSVYSDGVFTSR